MATAAIVVSPPEERVAAGPGATRAMGYYDPALRRVVLVGGADQPRAAGRDRVWSWSGRHWETVTDSGPAARSTAAIAYDMRRQLAVTTGGGRRTPNDSSFEVIADTWEGGPTSWRRGSGAELGARDHHAMVYDEARNALILFGGIPARRSDPWPGDTWERRPEGWVRVATDGPTGRGRTALAWDDARREVVLFGGVSAPGADGRTQTFFNDTWTWNGTAWRKVADEGPPARYAHAMVYDERARVVLLYSGAAAHRGAPLTDMWQWDGRRWTEIRLTGPTPGYRYQPVMVYDRARGRTVLYGTVDGVKDDTWEWDGQRWTEVVP
ncbi:MAG: hypothetical protein H7066_02525 [Cytophagaceae bacterium]|nr:hypothetical protein [Gemmatimonadaceae bacterium]